MSAKPVLSKGVEFTGLHIGLELTIPCLRIKCRIPSAKRGELIGRQLLNLPFDRFNFAHTTPNFARI